MTLKDRARKMREISYLMEGKEKLETKDVIGEVLTIDDYDIIGRSSEQPYAIIVFREYPDSFLFAGMVLTSLLLDLEADVEADNLTLHDELQKEKFQIKLTNKRAKNSHRTYTDVEVL